MLVFLEIAKQRYPGFYKICLNWSDRSLYYEIYVCGFLYLIEFSSSCTRSPSMRTTVEMPCRIYLTRPDLDTAERDTRKSGTLGVVADIA